LAAIIIEAGATKLGERAKHTLDHLIFASSSAKNPVIAPPTQICSPFQPLRKILIRNIHDFG